MGHTQLFCRSLFKGSYRLAKDELLRLKHMSDGIQQFLVERAVLALEVQHRHRLRGLKGTGRSGRGFHLTMLPAAPGNLSHTGTAQAFLLKLKGIFIESTVD